MSSESNRVIQRDEHMCITDALVAFLSAVPAGGDLRYVYNINYLRRHRSR